VGRGLGLRFLVVLSVGDNVRVHRIYSSGIMHAVLWSVGEPGRERPMSAQENKDLVRKEQEELWNHTGDLDAAEELFAAEQAEAVKQEAADFRQGFPDVISTIEDIIPFRAIDVTMFVPPQPTKSIR
jgi:hypothetical protein